MDEDEDYGPVVVIYDGEDYWGFPSVAKALLFLNEYLTQPPLTNMIRLEFDFPVKGVFDER